ncbi:HAD family hydrolase [Streptomyces sp. NPDC053431]|uniref:HAD family hydrolase n=1 Tax=Streptomyces sp. NPDC053431 TaxID=3365703 RepID=UPI0037D526E7
MQECRIAIFDVDGTLTAGPSAWRALLDGCNKWDPQGEEILSMFQSGQIDYWEFCQAHARLLERIPKRQLTEIIRASVRVRDGIAEPFSFLKALGYRIGFVSTGLQVLTDLIRAQYPVDFCRVNRLEFSYGISTGRAIVEVFENDKKSHAVELAALYGARHVISFGDSRGDIGLFAASDVSVAVNSYPDVECFSTYSYTGDSLVGLTTLLAPILSEPQRQ